MAEMPRIDSPQVVANLPSGHYDAHKITDVAGRQELMMADAVGKWRDVMFKINMEEKEKMDRVRVTEAVNAMREHVERLKWDDGGLMHQKGKNAINPINNRGEAVNMSADEYYMGDLQKGYAQMRARLGNAEQQELFDMYYSNIHTGFRNDITQHVGKEAWRYKTSVWQADLDQSTRSYANSASQENWEAADEAYMRANETLGILTDLEGLPENKREMVKAALWSKMDRSLCDDWLKKGQIQRVRAYMNMRGDKMNPDDSMAINMALNDLETSYMAQYAAEVDAPHIFGGNGAYAETVGADVSAGANSVTGLNGMLNPNGVPMAPISIAAISNPTMQGQYTPLMSGKSNAMQSADVSEVVQLPATASGKEGANVVMQRDGNTGAIYKMQTAQDIPLINEFKVNPKHIKQLTLGMQPPDGRRGNINPTTGMRYGYANPQNHAQLAHNALLYAESKHFGRYRYNKKTGDLELTVNPDTKAFGEYQVLPSTSKDPGYGIPPRPKDFDTWDIEKQADFVGMQGFMMANLCLSKFGYDVAKMAVAYHDGIGAMEGYMRRWNKVVEKANKEGKHLDPYGWVAYVSDEGKRHLRDVMSFYEKGIKANNNFGAGWDGTAFGGKAPPVSQFTQEKPKLKTADDYAKMSQEELEKQEGYFKVNTDGKYNDSGKANRGGIAPIAGGSVGKTPTSVEDANKNQIAAIAGGGQRQIVKDKNGNYVAISTGTDQSTVNSPSGGMVVIGSSGKGQGNQVAVNNATGLNIVGSSGQGAVFQYQGMAEPFDRQARAEQLFPNNKVGQVAYLKALDEKEKAMQKQREAFQKDLFQQVYNSVRENPNIIIPVGTMNALTPEHQKAIASLIKSIRSGEGEKTDINVYRELYTDPAKRKAADYEGLIANGLLTTADAKSLIKMTEEDRKKEMSGETYKPSMSQLQHMELSYDAAFGRGSAKSDPEKFNAYQDSVNSVLSSMRASGKPINEEVIQDVCDRMAEKWSSKGFFYSPSTFEMDVNDMPKRQRMEYTQMLLDNNMPVTENNLRYLARREVYIRKHNKKQKDFIQSLK